VGLAKSSGRARIRWSGRWIGARAFTATPEDEFFHHVIGDRHLATAIDGLFPSFRKVVILADLEERSYREIARMRELPIGT
jgi:RNA polymerase sigma-70 factor (ECF subfamily)